MGVEVTRTTVIDEKRRCPKCGKIEHQIRVGFNTSGTQRCKCKDCNICYAVDPRQHEYPEETKELAIKTYYSGVSGRGVGKMFGMNKSNVYRWIKNEPIVEKLIDCLELDGLFWFINKKPLTETRENIYILSMVSREPRQIIRHIVTQKKFSKYIQEVVDNAPEAKCYCTDSYVGYLDVVFPGEHIYNVRNKSDTFTLEGVNADLRHYIPVLARRSRCFCRTLKTLQAVVDVFIDAYNRFSLAKYNFRLTHPKSESPLGVVNFL